MLSNLLHKFPSVLKKKLKIKKEYVVTKFYKQVILKYINCFIYKIWFKNAI